MATREPKNKRKVSKKDQDILRKLAARQAEIAALPVHEMTEMEWRRVNALKPGRPLVWIGQIPWHEMNVNDELTCQAEDEFCRGLEWQLRAGLYQWEHARGDMVVEPVIYSPVVIRDTGFGIGEDARYVKVDTQSDISSREFHPQIQDLADIEKIKMPEVTVDEETSKLNYEILHKLFDGILRVERYGVGAQWFAPWDELIRWWGVEQAMMDMVERPELVHAAIDRLVSAYLCRLDQYVELNLLSLNNGNFSVGSGGPGFTDDLPQKDFDPGTVTTKVQWGNATAQIFSDVSPEMHWEFALQYEMRWLERFGLTYYGCCEPLHLKMDILKKVPNLRKVSMSPWVNIEKAIPHMAGHYVFSYKPNPAVLATDTWNLGHARQVLREALEKPCKNGCVVEVILKDISTVRYEPKRLWGWADMAKEVVAELA